jgi:broad specificity phosphatase PhoE
MELWLVRHAQTEWSVGGQHTGRSDIPLTDAGRDHARALKLPKRDWKLVLTSPLQRAVETAELAGFGDRATKRDELMEWDYGEYEGKTTDEIRAERPDWTIWNDGVVGGETADEVGKRCDRVIADALGAGGDVIAFAHGHVLRILAARWIEQPATFGGRIALGTGGVSVLGFEREARVISRWNLEA